MRFPAAFFTASAALAPAASAAEAGEWLFVQSAAEANLADGKLALDGVAPTMIAFTDRPERKVAVIETKEFVDTIWSEGPDSFAESPPNAVIAYSDGSEIKNAVVELSDLSHSGAPN